MFSAYAINVKFDKLFIPKLSFPPWEHTRLHPCVDRWILTRHTPLSSNKMMIFMKRSHSHSHQVCGTWNLRPDDLDELEATRPFLVVHQAGAKRYQALTIGTQEPFMQL
jgi:hypothetical protein